MEYKVIIKNADGTEVSEIVRSGDSAVFGRGTESLFTINDGLVSRAHCKLSISENNEVCVEDLGSSNGTKVNGNLITSLTKITSDNIVDIGNTSIEVIPVQNDDYEENEPTVNLDDGDDEELNSDSVNFARKFDVGKGPIDDIDGLELSAHDLAGRLNAICNLASRLFSAKTEKDIINIAIDIVLDLAKAERCSVILLHESSNLLDPVASKYNSKLKADETFSTSNTIVRYVIKTGESIITENAGDDDRFGISESIAISDVSSVMCVPLAAHDKVLGVIYTDSTGGYGGDFDNSTLAVMAAAAHQVAIAIERVRLHIGLENMFFGSMLALAASIEAKDKYTKGHSERVTCYSLMIADELGLSENERVVVELAGLLHDVGKIGVPEAVLCSNTKLTDEEFKLIQKHPEVGAEIILKMPELGGITSIREVAKVTKCHHEHFDGNGYPGGLAGKRIPIASRILAIADTFDAITSNRTYRKGQSVDIAIRILKECAGTQVDPEILKAFLRVEERGDIAFPEKVRARVAFDAELLGESTVVKKE